MEIRKQALEEERRRREDLEKRLQEETNRRQKLIDREVKLREKQRAQVRQKMKRTIRLSQAGSCVSMCSLIIDNCRLTSGKSCG